MKYLYHDIKSGLLYIDIYIQLCISLFIEIRIGGILEELWPTEQIHLLGFYDLEFVILILRFIS